MAISKNSGRQYPLVASVDFGFADIATAGTYEAIDLPGGAIVTGGVLEVITPDTGNGTIAVHIGSIVLLAAADYDSAARTFITETDVVTAAPDTVDIVVAVASLTVGTFRLVIEYIIDGRANEVNP